MSRSGFGGYTQGVSDATARAVLELKRLIGLRVSKVGDTMTGRLTIDPSLATEDEYIRLVGSGDRQPYLSVYGGTDANRAAYFGFPSATDDGVRLYAEKGDLRIGTLAANKVMTLYGTQVRDAAGRNFVRGNTARVVPQLIQYDTVTLALNASGQATVTFPEAYDVQPSVTTTIVQTLTNPHVVHLVGRTTTGFTVEVKHWNGTTFVPSASLSRTMSWHAIGQKSV